MQWDGNMLDMPGDCGVCPPTWHWVFQGISDCGGSDIAYVGGSSNPDPARCSGPGSVICWDNAYPNEGNPPFVEWCAYKSAVPCTGGSNLGYYYICVFG